MTVNEDNLFEMLFPDHDEDNPDCDDIGRLRINEIFSNNDVNEMSKYFDLNLYNESFSSNNEQSLCVMHFNIRNLLINKSELESNISLMKHSPDVIALSETWLDKFDDTVFEFKGYTSYNVIRDAPHGGVSMLVKDSLESSLIEKFSFINSEIEICTVSIKLKNDEYVASVIYRPHFKYDNVKEFKNAIEPILNDKLFKKSKTILTGDFNINLLEHNNHPDTNDFLVFMQNLFYLPVIARATRFPEGQQRAMPSLLDHIYINFSPPSISGILKLSITDHLPVFITFLLPSPKVSNHKIKFRIFNEENRKKFTRELSYIMWEELLSSEDININFSKFFTIFQKLYNTHFPVVSKTISAKRLSHPWVTPILVNSIKNMNASLSEFKRGLISWDEYKRIRNQTNTLLKTSKRNYYVTLFNNFKNNTKKLWESLNTLNKSSPPRRGTPNIISNNSILTEFVDIANAFNSFFANVGANLNSKIPPAEDDPMDFMRGNYPNSMEVPPVNLQDVIKVVKSLKKKKCHIDDFAPFIIKENIHLLAQPISYLFNQSTSSGKFPKALKFARIIPLHKKGPKTDLNNYRPISLLNIFSKIFEKLMKSHLVAFIHKNEILSKSQFGFQEGKSTLDALVKFSSEVYSQLDKSNFLLSIFVDFSKAFDTVPHDLLLRKLSFYGIRGIIFDWFADYLADRSHVTMIDGSQSSTNEVKMGVPRGSVLGPVLFLLFVNDLPNFSEILTSILFADDANLSMSGPDPAELIMIANIELNKLRNWCIANRISINSLKTFFLLFGNHHPLNLPILTIKSGFSYEVIKRATNIKFLGIYYDDNMSFKTHVNYLVQRLSRTSSLIYQLKEFMPSFVLKTIYNAHIASLLNYCNIIWSGAYDTTLLPLIRLLKRIIRNMTNSDFLAHNNPLLRETKVLTLDLLRSYNLGLYFIKYKIYNNDELQRHHSYNTRFKANLRMPEYRTRLYRNSFICTAIDVYNEIYESPFVDLGNIFTLATLKKRLKTYFLSKL